MHNKRRKHARSSVFTHNQGWHIFALHGTEILESYFPKVRGFYRKCMNKHRQEVRIVKSVRLQDHPGKTWSDFIFMVNYSMLLVDEEPFH
jgi:predicted N-acyltransferase